MLNLKYKKIDKVEIVKEIFANLSDTVRLDLINGNPEFPELRDIYDIMLDNIEAKSNLQFYAELYKELMGFVIASESPIYADCVVVNVLCVIKRYRKNGFANQMLNQIEKIARKDKAKKIVITYSKAGKNLFLNNGYKLYLEISFPISEIDDATSLLKNISSEQLESTTIDGQTHLLLSVDSVRPTLINRLKEQIPNLNAKYIFEKELRKK